MRFEILERMALEGVQEMQFLFGFLKEHGFGCEKNLKEANYWYERAAEKGFAPAAYMLFYTNSRDKNQFEARTHTDVEHQSALDWCRKAAREGFAPAQLDLSPYEFDPDESFQLALSAAEQGYASAAYYVGLLYANGESGVTKNLQTAFDWYQKAAELGHENAAYLVAEMYREGKGVLKDEGLALQWYLKAFDLKSHIAANMLGQVFSQGVLGQEKDPTKANFYNAKRMEYLKRWGNSFEHPDRTSEVNSENS